MYFQEEYTKANTVNMLAQRNKKMQLIRKGLKIMPIMNKNTYELEQKVQKRKRKQSFKSMKSIHQVNLHVDSDDQSPIDIKNNFQQKYQMLEKIGQGSNGIVKRCYHKSKNKHFAVKIIQMNDEHIQMMKQTFISIKKLNNKHIIKYNALYFNHKKKRCYLVMELLQKNSLSHYLVKDQQELKQIAEMILDGLNELHKNGICHRDIKPDNILYDKENKELKLIDFGICKSIYKRGRYQQMLTNTGTLYYKAPEMFKGAGYNEKIDLWALGITLYRLITGRTPFQSIYLSDTISNIQTKQIDIKDKAFTKYSSMFQNFLARLLKRKREERLSAEESKKHFWFETGSDWGDLLTRSDSTKFWQFSATQQNQFSINQNEENGSPYNLKNMKRKKSFDGKTEIEPQTSSSLNNRNQLKKKLEYQGVLGELCSSEEQDEKICIQVDQEN